MMAEHDEVFTRLEREYEATRIITVVQRDSEPPRVEWDAALSESEVIANLFKALLFMTLDEFVLDMFDDLGDDEEVEGGEER